MKTELNNMERILYKYIDIDGGKSMIVYQNLQFSNACSLNDPFDCHPKLIDFSNDPIPKLFKDKPGFFDIGIKETNAENLRNDTYLCSLSKVKDSLLMWAHYCCNHKGICIGLNINKVFESVPPFFCYIYIKPLIIEVKYQDIIKRPDAYKSKFDFFSYQLGTKAKDWEYEQEVRLIAIQPNHKYSALTPNQTDMLEKNPDIVWQRSDIHYYLPLNKDCFESIYFGINIDKNKKEKIIRYVKENLNPHIKLYQMAIDENALRLKPVEL